MHSTARARHPNGTHFHAGDIGLIVGQFGWHRRCNQQVEKPDTAGGYNGWSCNYYTVCQSQCPFQQYEVLQTCRATFTEGSEPHWQRGSDAGIGQRRSRCAAVWDFRRWNQSCPRDGCRCVAQRCTEASGDGSRCADFLTVLHAQL